MRSMFTSSMKMLTGYSRMRPRRLMNIKPGQKNK